MTRQFTPQHAVELESLQRRVNDLTKLQRQDSDKLYQKVLDLSQMKAIERGDKGSPDKRLGNAVIDAVFVSSYPDELFAILKEYIES